MANKTLSSATRAKNDEFYTQLTDIEKELKHYRKHFKGKTVLCNCDDPFESNFFKYFVLNFNRLKIKKIIATCYSTSTVAGTHLKLHTRSSDGQMSLSFNLTGELAIESEETKRKPYKAIVNVVHDTNGDGGIDMLDVVELFKSGENQLAELDGDGDFRSDECIELLKESDIVVTNPPFSLFREYIYTLIKHDKNFIVIGNQNAITYKEIFPLLMRNRMWLGNNSGDMSFTVPDYYEPRETRYWQDETGQKWRSMGNICWFTNLDIKKRHEEMILVKRYNEDDYPKYDNYDAINVNRTADIPYDYDGVMGVPITFMDKYTPDQFEIIGLAPERLSEKESSLQVKRYKNAVQHKKDGTTCNGNKVNDGPTLLHDVQPLKYPYYTSETVPNKYIEVLYARILIRNKHPEVPKGD